MFKKYHIVGLALILFFVLQISDCYSNENYNRDIRQQLESCVDRRERDNVSADDCLSTVTAANSAFRSATSNHGLTYMIVVILIGFLAGRIIQLEDLIKESSKEKDV